MAKINPICDMCKVARTRFYEDGLSLCRPCYNEHMRGKPQESVPEAAPESEQVIDEPDHIKPDWPKPDLEYIERRYPDTFVDPEPEPEKPKPKPRKRNRSKAKK